MLHRWAVFFLASLAAAQVCVTPTGTLCRTLVYESSGWANRSWGFHAVDRYSDRITEALESSGRALLRVVHRSYRYHLLPAESYDRTRLIFPAEGRTWEIERSRSEVRDMGGVWSFSEYWTHDRDCAQRAELAGTGARRTGRDPVIAGVRSIEYAWGGAAERWEQTISFAPELGCSAVEFTLTTWTARGFRIAEKHLRIVSASLGEPDASLFAIPTRYSFVPGGTWPYLWMDKFPGNITSTGFSRVVP